MKSNNEPLSSITHFIGMLLSIAGLVLLIVFSAMYGTAWHVVSFSIFGASLILLYFVSSLYHLLPLESKARRIFRKIDHSMIYILIAGTYTPICLVPLRGGWGWSIFGVVWGLAISFIVLKNVDIKIPRWLFIGSYVLIGWLILIALAPLMKTISFEGLLWLLIGGTFYTLGVIFYSLDPIIKRTRWFGMHEIFHIFVMGGSFSHFWLMLKFVLPI